MLLSFLFYPLFVLIIIIFSLIKSVFCANILAVTDLTSPSHHLFNDILLYELVKRGHNVTLLGHDQDKHNHPNYTHIVMEGVYEKIFKEIKIVILNTFDSYETIKIFNTYTKMICEFDFKSEGLKKLVNYPDNFKFDLIIWDVNAGYCLYPLASKFGNPPIVGINPFITQINSFLNIHQSYIPFMLSMHSNKMTYFQRITNNFWQIAFQLYRKYYILPEQSQLAEKYFGKTKQTIEEFERNISILLTNYNPVFDYVEALPPNIIPIGGLQIKTAPLPDDLKEILDKSHDGAILFSLGTNVKWENLDDKFIDSIINSLSKLKQNIIWKVGSFNYKGKIPKNIYMKKWIPQSGILSHPNIVLFISHCGLLSSNEIIYYGKPVIAIPFFLDQFLNAGNLQSKKIGEIIEMNEINEKSFYDIIIKVINNKTYSDNVKKLSKLYNDYPQKPLDLAVFWIDYVLRNGPPEHFNLITRDVNLIEYYNLDIILTYLSVMVLFVALKFYLIKKLYNYLFVKKTLKLKSQ